MENQLIELLRKINDKGHSVCWSKCLYMADKSLGIPSEWIISVTIAPHDDCFTTHDIPTMIAKVEGWMIGMGY